VLGCGRDSVLEASDLRSSVQKQLGNPSMPSVIIRSKQSSAFAVLARGKHASEDKVICSGSTADEVQQEFEKQYAGTPTSAPKRLQRIEFEVKQDRPGLLAEASALFKSHQVNIRSALISTCNKGKTAKHVYEFSGPADAEVSSATFSGLKKGFEKLQYGENPNTVEPIKGQPVETVDELRAKVLELTKQLGACQTENVRLSSALEEALGKK